jgi:5-oxoprolinase (ATP-hydrolysing)
MEAKKNSWQLWIDTGGTFTDGIAVSPEGQWKRVKVLSTGCVRATLTARLSEACYRFEARWPAASDIFGGYGLYVLEEGRALLGRVRRIDPEAGLLYTEVDFPLAAPITVELSAGEEAPLLAARLATETPLNEPLPPIALRLGTTKGTNALLERKGAPVSLFITRGFADLPYIGTQQRPDLFQLDIPEPAFGPAQIIEVDERIDASGAVVKPLPSGDEFQQLIAAARHGSVAIALLHAYRNPAHEQQLAEALREAGAGFVSVSSELSPVVKLLSRVQTCVVDAYLASIIHPYLQRIASGLATDGRFWVMSSSGGLAPWRQYRPKDSLLSGPAGGVVGAARVARNLGFNRVLTLDMGGTSTDTARYDGAFDYRFHTDIEGIQLLSPALAIETVAAGGGSICQVRNGQMEVGSESAGAYPGPACYGAGGPLTITDVNLLLGKLDPRRMGIPVSAAAAEAALEGVQLALVDDEGRMPDRQNLLRGFERIANEKMAEAIRRISVARGFDPREYALLAFGGAGGLHACAVAEMLEVDTVLLPADAGLLSAYGMGQAAVERMAEVQVLAPLAEVEAELAARIAELAEQAAGQLRSEGFDLEQLSPPRALLFLRFWGQESALELAYVAGEPIAPAFNRAYQQLFGHYPTGQTLELESLRVFVSARLRPNNNEDTPPPARYTPKAETKRPQLAVYDWAALQPGAHLSEGPAVLAGDHATAYLPAGWQLDIQPGSHALLRHMNKVQTPAPTFEEAAELTLFTRRFMAIAEDMGAQLQRTAFSVNVKERLDFSCALLDAQARLLVNAPHIPVHLGSLGVCARLVLARLAVAPGDVVIVNHPGYGGSHLPDITLLQGVFMPDGRLLGYVINRAHHAEIGGKRPGSMPPDARNLAEEGVVFAPSYLAKAGEVQWATIREQLTQAPWPSRAPEDNLADINAALASLRTGADALVQLATRYGPDKVEHHMAVLQKAATRQLQQALAPWQGQVLTASESLDDGSQIQVEIRAGHKRWQIDFRGSSGRHPGNLNANVSIVYSAVIYVLRLLCGGHTPLNEGLLEDIDIILPDDSFLHPHFYDDPRECPAVVGGNTEVSQRIVDTLLKAFGLAAASQGTMNNFLFGNDRFGYYETIGGGAGAGPGFNGRSGVHQHMTNTRITDPEDLERRYPVRLLRFALRRGSGGAGRYTGGDGLIREVEALAPLHATLLTQRRAQGPYGMAGGEAGQPGSQYVRRAYGAVEALAGIAAITLAPGDRLTIETPGGGGWGKKGK